MPEPREFLKGFGLIPGKKFGGYKIISAEASHHAVERYKEYDYSINLDLEGSGSHDTLIKEINNFISGNRIIHTRWGNPYECSIKSITKISIHMDGNSNKISIHMDGKSYRV